MRESTVELDEYSFTLPGPAGRIWDALLEVALMGLCVPGAVLESVDGDTVHGRLKVTAGSMNRVHTGTGRFAERDKAAGTLVFQACNRESGGYGSWSATIRIVLTDGGHETYVTVQATVIVTGRPGEVSPDAVRKFGRQLVELSGTNLAVRLGAPGNVVTVRAQHLFLPKTSFSLVKRRAGTRG